MPNDAARRIRFGDFEADLSTGELRKAGRLVRLQDQPFRVLKCLLESPGEIVTRDELRQEIWGEDVYVDFERSLNTSVARLREALGDSPTRPTYIETAPRKGYRFIGPLSGEPGLPATESEESAVGPVPVLSRTWLRISVVAVGLGLVGIAAWRLTSRIPPAEPPELRAEPLTYYEGFESEPTFSPDGNQVAFTWNGAKQDNFDVYVKTVDGTQPLRLTSAPEREFSPAWSPDGQWIAFMRELPGFRAEVVRLAAVGGREYKLAEVQLNERRYAPSSGVFDRYLCWTADSRSLILMHRGSDADPLSLFRFDIQSGSLSRLTTAPAGSVGDRNPAVSHDGRSLAFSGSRGKRSGLIILPLDDSSSPAGEALLVPVLEGPLWNLTWTAGNDLVVSKATELWRLDPRSQEMTRLAHISGRSFLPEIPRSTDRLVYAQQVLQSNIYRLDLTTGAVVKLIASTGADGNHQYSPDGRGIVFQSSRSSQHRIWISKEDGTSPAPIATLGGSPRWAPDGSAVAFDGPTEPDNRAVSDIWTVSPAGGAPRRLTDPSTDDRVPNWSRDGQWVYFASLGHREDYGPASQLWKIHVESGQRVQVTRNGGFYASESVDRKFVYFTKGMRDRTLWRVPINGGAEVQVLERLTTWPNFELAEDGIYYTPRLAPGETPVIMFYNFSDESKVEVLAANRPFLSGLSLSPDRRYLLFDQIDHEGSNLMLVEGFR